METPHNRQQSSAHSEITMMVAQKLIFQVPCNKLRPLNSIQYQHIKKVKWIFIYCKPHILNTSILS